MAHCGVGSRRECEEFIAEGRVQLNGRVVDKPGTLVEPGEDEVRYDGERLNPQRIVHFLLNKPRGVVCSQKGAPRAIDYAPQSARDLRLFTIGRLDVDSEGAIILTNDGDLTHLVSHPRFEVAKTYRVEVEGHPDDATLEKMRRGVWLAEGKTGGAEVKIGKRTRTRTVLEVTLKEGRHREVRRVCARLGHEVRRLVRTHIGTVQLGRLDRGHTRTLEPEEIEALRKSAKVVIRLGATPRALSVSLGQRRARGGPGGSRKEGGGGAGRLKTAGARKPKQGAATGGPSRPGKRTTTRASKPARSRKGGPARRGGSSGGPKRRGGR